MKVGTDFDRGELVRAMQSVKLDELKLLAASMVSPAQVRVLPGVK
jgi:hypothetical protein